VAAIGIGRFGYAYRLPVVDLVGLVDREVARGSSSGAGERDVLVPGHQRSNARYILSRRPHFILISENQQDNFPAARELLASPEFRTQYVYDPAVFGYRLRSASDSNAPRR
jgi:hypothetical protein